MTSLNAHIGINVNHGTGVSDVNAKYDLNEDGVVNKVDRNIYQPTKNMKKLVERIESIKNNI